MGGILAIAIFWTAFDHGSYASQSWASAGILVVWSAGLVLAVLGSRVRMSRAAAAALLLLFCFVGLTGLSAFWASGADGPFLTAARTLVYVGVAALIAWTARPAELWWWASGVAAGIVAVLVVALGSRCFPGLFGTSHVAGFLSVGNTRLSYPVGYWNGLAALLALGWPLLLGLASGFRSRLTMLALVPLPGIAVAIYLASSRSGVAAAAIGIVAFLALTSRRWRALAATVPAIVASALAVGYVSQLHELVDGPISVATGRGDGHRAAIVVIGAGMGAAAAYGILLRLFKRVVAPTWVGWIATALVVLAGIAVVATSDPARRWHDFTTAPSSAGGAGYIQSHFLSGNGNWRWQFWRAAWHAFLAAPLVGHGAGSYAAWWAQHGVVVGYVGSAHSLYLQTLAELGIVGLVLLVGAFAVAMASAVAAVLKPSAADRVALAAVLAAFASFAVAAGVDWIWDVPAVAWVGMTLFGLMLSATRPWGAPPIRRTRARQLAFACVIAVAVLALAAEVDAYASESALAASGSAATAGNLSRALADANDARSLRPWAAGPYTQLALVHEARGQLRLADQDIQASLAHESNDWRIWLIAARIETKLGAIRDARASYDHARELNPRSPVFTGG